MKIFLVLFFFSLEALSHQPKLINYSPLQENPHIVIDPEISKAYYSKLNGEPHYYIIDNKEEFLFYAGILTPKVNESYQWVSIEVLDENKNVIYSGDGQNFDWNAWYEPYARDWYWKGPEIGTERNQEFKTSFKISAGKYYIKVFSENNDSHYSLAVGEAEFFGSNLWEQILTWIPIIFYIGPFMDIVHWQKFDIRAYILHIALIVLLSIIYILIKKIFFRKKI
tara:strand:+ start:431 stop:1102 length:672 start_codon:yes stop_codon:yes gene_type:complete